MKKAPVFMDAMAGAAQGAEQLVRFVERDGRDGHRAFELRDGLTKRFFNRHAALQSRRGRWRSRGC